MIFLKWHFILAYWKAWRGWPSLSNVGCLGQEGWAKSKRGSERRKKKDVVRSTWGMTETWPGMNHNEMQNGVDCQGRANKVWWKMDRGWRRTAFEEQSTFPARSWPRKLCLSHVCFAWLTEHRYKRENLTRSSKKNQAYLKTVSLTIPVLTTICRASSSWKC